MDVVQISENGYCVGDHSVFVFPSENLIHGIIRGEQTPECARAIESLIVKLNETIKGKTSYLVDLNEAGKSSSEARKTWTRLSDEKNIHKVAMFGIHPVAMVLASFVTNISKKNEMQFSKTKEEALAWIKEKSQVFGMNCPSI